MIEFDNITVVRDGLKFFLGKQIGKGMCREVFENPFDSTTVIKYEIAGFQNIREYELWKEVEGSPLAKWFAPCVDISACGIFLVQKKTEKPLHCDYPKEVPHFFVDTKFNNYGIIVEKGKKRFVCHDYGSFLWSKGLGKRLVKADWWKE